MKQKDREEIRRILQKIREKSVLAVKGGSGGAKRFSMRDPQVIWELGKALEKTLQNDNISVEKKKETIRKISRKYDTEILGEKNEWCITAFDWVDHFKEKDHYLFVCKLAGYRELKEKNRFNKRRLRYLRSIYTKKEEPNLPKNKISLLTKKLQEDSTLELNDPDYLSIITKIRGKQKIDWSFVFSTIDDLSSLVEGVIDDKENSKEREKLRNDLSTSLIKQLRYTLQLCVMNEENDFENAYEIAKETFKIKTKTKYDDFQKLLDYLKLIIKDFELKKKKIKKSDFYELEQLNSKLDAITDETIYREFMDRKKSIGEVFG